MPSQQPLGFLDNLWRYIRTPLGGIIALCLLLTTLVVAAMIWVHSTAVDVAALFAVLLMIFWAMRFIMQRTPKEDGGLVASEERYMFRDYLDISYGTNEGSVTRREAIEASEKTPAPRTLTEIGRQQLPPKGAPQ